MTAPVSRPVLIFDGDCGLCTTFARFVARRVVTAGSTSIAPWQRLDLAELGLTPDQCRAAVQWVGARSEGGSATVLSGHAAIAATLRTGHLVWRPVGALMVAPGFSCLAKRLYSWVATHRYALPGGTPACRTQDPNEPT